MLFVAAPWSQFVRIACLSCCAPVCCLPKCVEVPGAGAGPDVHMVINFDLFTLNPTVCGVGTHGARSDSVKLEKKFSKLSVRYPGPAPGKGVTSLFQVEGLGDDI